MGGNKGKKMIIILGFSLIVYFGYLVTKLVSSELNIFERAGLSYSLGFGLFTWGAYILSSQGVKITLGNLSIFLILLIFSLSVILRKISAKASSKNLTFLSWQNPTRLEKYILLAIGVLIIFSFLNAFYWPVNEWDALVLYDFRAKVILERGYFTQIAKEFEYFAHYPLLTSLAHTWTYLLGGKNPQFIYSSFLLSFAIAFYGTLRRFSSRLTGLVSLLLMVSSPLILHHSTFAYTNLPYTIYLVLGFIYLYIFLVTEKVDYLILSALLIGLSTWIRQHEPFWIAGLLILLPYLIIKKRYFYTFLYSAIFLIIFGSWKVYEIGLSSESYANPDYVSFSRIKFAELININRIRETLVFIYKSIFASWGAIPLLALLVSVFNIRKILRGKESFLLLIIVTNLFLLIAGAYIFTFTYPTWRQIPDSAQRIAMFFIPLLVYYVGISEFAQKYIAEMFGEKNQKDL